MSVGRRLALPVAVLAALLAVGAIATPHASASGKPKLRGPTLLWKAYPLVQQPRTPGARRSASQTREAVGPTAAEGRQLDHMLLLSALLASLLAAGTVVLLRRPTALRVGPSIRGRGRAGGRTPRPQRRPHPRRRRAEETSRAPQLPPETVAEPEAPREDAGAPGEPTDELQRVLDGLLAALQPQPPRPEQERSPELELRELIVRKYAAPASARQRIEREIDAALERVESRRIAQARARAACRTSLAHSRIRLWRGLIKSRLYAAMAGAEGAFAVSPPFVMRDAAVPGPQARRALSSLLTELSHAGWTVVAQGSAWYDHTLELLPPDTDAASTGAPPDDEILPTIVYKLPRDDQGTESSR